MARAWLRLGLLTAVLFAVGAFVWLQVPGDAPTATLPSAPAVAGMALALDGGIRDDCRSCHFGWEAPIGVEARRVVPPEGPAAVEARVGATSGYTLPVVLARPLAAGEEAPPLSFEERSAIAVGGGEPVRLSFQLPGSASVLVAQVLSGESYKRPDLRFTVSGGGAVAEGNGSRSNKAALLLPPEGAPLEGSVMVEVRVVDSESGPAPVRIRVTAIPMGYVAHLDASRGRPATLSWSGAEAAERFALVALAWNEHPSETWMITSDADMAIYTGVVATSTGPEAEGNPATPLDPSASVVLWEERFDGVRAHQRNARGEWRILAPNLVTAREDPRRVPFAGGQAFVGLDALPEGTTHVTLTFTWQKRNPLAPDPSWRFAVSQPHLPDFAYPEPTSEVPGERVLVVPIPPGDADGRRGWFQGYSLLVLGSDGRAAFDGTSILRIEASRAP